MPRPNNPHEFVVDGIRYSIGEFDVEVKKQPGPDVIQLPDGRWVHLHWSNADDGWRINHVGQVRVLFAPATSLGPVEDV